MQETYKIGEKEYPVVGHARIVDKGNVIGTVPIVDFPMMSDYKWQLNCLKGRLEHPECYADLENAEEIIAKLRRWLEDNKEKATEKELKEFMEVATL